MKKQNVIRIMAMLMVCVLLCPLMGCATTLKGTYVAKDSLIQQSLTFKEDNRVEMSAFGLEIEGDYLIEDGTITITYSVLNLSYDWVKSFKKDGNSIFVDGIEFIKETN